MARVAEGRLGPLMMDVAGLSLDQTEREMLAHPAVGGVIVFARHCHDSDALRELVREIKALRSPPLIIAVDQEGGRVQRVQDRLTRLPPARAYGWLLDREGAAQAAAVTRAAGWLMAFELLELGIDLSFAPVLDLDSGQSSVIGDRAFHAAPNPVTRLAGAFMTGMRDAGMCVVAKHFPGHGSVHGDSHVLLPVDERSIHDIRERDMRPFERLASQLDAVMTAHVLYPRIDSLPPTFSRHWLQHELRTRIGFRGAIVSDDLCMVGAAELGSIDARVEAALDAGCELLLACNDRQAGIAALEQIGKRGPLAANCDWSRLAPGPARSSAQSDISELALTAARTLHQRFEDALLAD